MTAQTLEQEFEEFKALHKYSVLYAVIKRYYTDLQETGINVPDFMREDTPEKLAELQMRKIMLLPDNLKTFNKLYESAWEEVKKYDV